MDVPGDLMLDQRSVTITTPALLADPCSLAPRPDEHSPNCTASRGRAELRLFLADPFIPDHVAQRLRPVKPPLDGEAAPTLHQRAITAPP
jgi:hypothetical protein